MSTLIIIRGNSGSGKSTVAKRLRYELGYETMLIPQDIVRRDILRTKDTPDNPSIRLIKDLAEYGHGIGYDVIIEGILTQDKYGTMLCGLMEMFDNVHVYYLDIPFKETLRRHSFKPNAHEFGEEDMRRWWVEKDVLGVQNERILTDDLSEDQIVASIMMEVGEEATRL